MSGGGRRGWWRSVGGGRGAPVEEQPELVEEVLEEEWFCLGCCGRVST